MARKPAPSALLDLPPVAGLSALRAGLMAMNVLPMVMPGEKQSRDRLLSTLDERPSTVLFADISHSRASNSSTLLDLDGVIPHGAARSRVYLTRLAGGHVSEADRQWVRSLGFADLIPEFDALDCEGQLRSALDAVARSLELEALLPADLARYARVMNEERDRTSPRAVIRALTGHTAETFAELLFRSLSIEDRSHHLQTYANCFVGSEAVAWISSALHRSAAESVALGQALGKLGLLVHVTHDHPFLDDQLFYRLVWSDGPGELALGGVYQSLREPGGVRAATRSYIGKDYVDCWVGAEAVGWVATHFKVSRLEAWRSLWRLAQFGLIEHVTRSRPFIDGDFYYRFPSALSKESP